MPRHSTKPTRTGPAGKPKKPYPDFPLFPHASRRWAKKIRGRFYYFGPWTADDDGGAYAALDKYTQQAPDLHAGRTPRAPSEGLTIRDLCNRFLATKKTDRELGKIGERTFSEYHRACRLLIDAFGPERVAADVRPEDFEKLYKKLAAKHGVSTLGREITMCRSVFKYANDADLVDRPIKFGPRFRAPSKADCRKARAKRRREDGARMFTAPEIRRMIDKAEGQLKGMILLGINGGLGNTDCATLPIGALDLERGWIDFPRPKTGIERRIPLWPETVKALQAVLAKRRTPKRKQDAKLVFVTRCGNPWVHNEAVEKKDHTGKTTVRAKADDALAKEVAKLLQTLRIVRRGLGFYGLRYTFETIGGESRDQVAVDAIMGHVDASMAAVYRERIGDDRLKAVTDHVRQWLFGDAEEAEPEAEEADKTPD